MLAARRALAALLAAALAMLALPATGFAVLNLVYTPAPAANAISDGAPGVPGLKDAERQAPIFEDPRWPSGRQIGKLSGDGLAAMPTAEAMAAALRAGMRGVTVDGRTTPVGDRVGVDEITPADWSPTASSRLRQAMEMLGPDAERVIFYASPALTAQVGKTDPRRGLSSTLAPLVQAVSAGAHVFLEVYTGDLNPLSRVDMATYLARWHDRWTGGADRLHVLFGPSGGTSQADLWNRARSTPAGRALLKNGAGAFALPDAEDGAAWLAALRVFLAQPDASPPGGDVEVPSGGGVSTGVEDGQAVRPGTAIRVIITRPGRASAFLLAPDGTRRGLAVFDTPATRAIELPGPGRIKPGVYRFVIVVDGEGLEDRVETTIRVGATAAPAPGPRGSGGATAGQLLINQRISQAAVRRLNAVQEWLDAGLVRGDLAGGTLAAADFAAGVVTGPGPVQPVEPAAPRPVVVAPARPSAGGTPRLSIAQLRINQRISQAAVRRSNALIERLVRGLTGGDIRDGEITAGKHEPGLVVISAAPGPEPAPSETRVAPPARGSGNLTLTKGQLQINQRISQAAVRRANALVARLEAGLTGADIADGSVTAADLAPAG